MLDSSLNIGYTGSGHCYAARTEDLESGLRVLDFVCHTRMKLRFVTEMESRDYFGLSISQLLLQKSQKMAKSNLLMYKIIWRGRKFVLIRGKRVK